MTSEQSPCGRYEAPSGEALRAKYLTLGPIALKALESDLAALPAAEQDQYLNILLGVEGRSANPAMHGRIDDMLRHAEQSEDLYLSVQGGNNVHRPRSVIKLVAAKAIDTDDTSKLVKAA